ncbi:DUF945 family protein [Sulfurimonas microaerophilic]|uniref:DUF945 family protein n=1 Tax=Sulfurimonas microaerophilic TaxID=3058392 RepID=UPI002714F27B|nr:DUF945 family protein [Sulfurimonas sp. hsl 1-7]
MKKVSILIVLVIGVLATLPIIGNKYVSSTMDERVNELKNHGLEVKESLETSSYLTTSKHYEFLLQDSAKFIDFLNQYATNQIPPYVDSLINGVVVGVDVEHSNIPFFSTIALDIYPIDFSEKMMESLKKNDINFYKQLDSFLATKGLSYHMNYHLSSEQFDGYIKDIEQTFKAEDGTTLTLFLNDTKFDGKGRLIAPQSSLFHIGKLNLNIVDKRDKFVFNVENFQGSSDFTSKATYNTDLSVKNFKFIVDEKNDALYMNVNDFSGKFASDDQGEKTKLFGTSAFKEMTIEGSELDLAVKEFKYEFALSQLDKELFDKLQTLVADQNVKTGRTTSKEIEKVIIDLFSKGLELNIKNISVDDIIYNKTKEYKGFSFNSLVNIKADPDLAVKMKQMPMDALNNIDMSSELVLSKELYQELENKGLNIYTYAEVQENSVKFKSTYKNGQLLVNGKPIN